MAPRNKIVQVGGRDFVVRPLLGKVARELAEQKADGFDPMLDIVTAVLRRTAPDITKDWLLENGDVSEYREVLEALNEVTAAPKAAPGEAPAP